MSSRAFVFGDEIDTDQLAPGQFMRGGIEALAANCLAAIRPGFGAQVQPGDVIVAGRNFGVGSSREQAAQALKYLGVAGVVATSFAGIFYRNAINLGLPVLIASSIDRIEDGDTVLLASDFSKLILCDKNQEVELSPLPENIRRMLDDGGLVPHLMKRFDRDRQQGKR